MNNIKLVVFDCDGVMFDTSEGNRVYYNRILNYLGMRDMTDEEFHYSHSHSVDDSLAYLFKGREEFLGEAKAYQQAMDYGDFIPYMNIEPDLMPLLKYLRPGYKTAIATNRSTTMPKVMEEFELTPYFDAVATALDVKVPKPDPEMMLLVLGKLNISPNQAIYVGDSAVDEAVAKKTGVPLVAYKNSDLDAAFHIERLWEIKDILG